MVGDSQSGEAAKGRDRAKCFQEEPEMSSLIQPFQGPSGTRATPSIAAARGARGAAPSSAASESEAPVSLDTLPSSPPPEVVSQIETAGATYEKLRSEGYEVRYAHDEQSRRTTVELRDAAGIVVKTLSPAEAVELAMGGTLGQVDGR
jgi:hypothetical protein